jgi:hypothetical protein
MTHLILNRVIPSRKPAVCGWVPGGGWHWRNTFSVTPGVAATLAEPSGALCPACRGAIVAAVAAALEAKKMAPAAKARLRAAAAKKRAETAGRASLAGYDPLWFRMAVDMVAEEHEAARPGWAYGPDFTAGRIPAEALGLRCHWATGFDPSGMSWETARSRHVAAWAAFRRLPADKLAVLADHLPGWKVVEWWAWRGRSAAPVALRVWPVAALCGVLAALWPGPDPREPSGRPLWLRQAKTLRLFTAGYIAKLGRPAPAG